MSGIRKIFSRLLTRRQQPPSKLDSSNLPLGLSREQVEQIQVLTELIPYKHYSAALERLYENNIAAILRPSSHDAYLFQCGVCFALEQIAALPGDLTLKLREQDARHTHSTPEPDTDASAVFANSPYWDAYQRLGRSARKYGGTGVPLPGQRHDSPVPPGENGG